MSQIAELELEIMGIRPEDVALGNTYISGRMHRYPDGRGVLSLAIARMTMDATDPLPSLGMDVRHMSQTWDRGGSYLNPREIDPSVGRLPGEEP